MKGFVRIYSMETGIFHRNQRGIQTKVSFSIQYEDGQIIKTEILIPSSLYSPSHDIIMISIKTYFNDNLVYIG